MEDVKWLTAEELVEYYTLITMWKLKKYKTPIQIAEKFTWNEFDEVITPPPPRI